MEALRRDERRRQPLQCAGLSLFEVQGQYISKAFHAVQLQQLVASRFAQLALLNESKRPHHARLRAGAIQKTRCAS